MTSIFLDYQRQVSYSERMRSTQEATVSTDIPEEVLQFLQSRNFHPEQLQNLKGTLMFLIIKVDLLIKCVNIT